MDIETLVAKIGVMLKKFDAFERATTDMLNFTKKELKTPTPQENMTLDQKVLILKREEKRLESLISQIKNRREEFKNTLENQGHGNLVEVAEILKSVF